MTTSTTGRGLALAAGLVASAGALAILLQDAIRTNVWTLEHGLIPALMIVQIFTSHLIGSALSSRRWLSAAGFLVVALAATWGVLYTSVGKQSQVTAEVSAVADDVNARRADLLKRLAANQDMLDGARTQLAAECASGKGKKCEGITATVKVYEDAVSGNTAALAALGPARPVAVKADKMAELIAALTGRETATAKSVLVLIEPFTYAVIFEGAALVCFGFAFARNSKPGASGRLPERQSEAPMKAANDPGNGGNPGGNPGNRRRKPFAKANARADVIDLVARRQAIPSQETLSDRWGVGKGTVSKWLATFETEGLIARETIGRCKAVIAA